MREKARHRARLEGRIFPHPGSPWEGIKESSLRELVLRLTVLG